MAVELVPIEVEFPHGLPIGLAPLPSQRSDWKYHWDGYNVPVCRHTGEAFLIGPCWPDQIWVLNLCTNAISKRFQVPAGFQPLHVELVNRGTCLAVVGRDESAKVHLGVYLVDAGGHWTHWAAVPACVCDFTLAGEAVAVFHDCVCVLNAYHDPCCAQIWQCEQQGEGQMALFQATSGREVAFNVMSGSIPAADDDRLRCWVYRCAADAHERLLVVTVERRGQMLHDTFAICLYEGQRDVNKFVRLAELRLTESFAAETWNFYFMQHSECSALRGAVAVLFHGQNALYLWQVDDGAGGVGEPAISLAYTVRWAFGDLMCSFIHRDTWYLFCANDADMGGVKQYRMRLGSQVPELMDLATRGVLGHFNKILQLPQAGREAALMAAGIPASVVLKLPRLPM